VFVSPVAGTRPLHRRTKVSIRIPKQAALGKRRGHHQDLIAMDTRINLNRLGRAQDHDFRLIPEAEARKDLAERLGVNALRKLRMEGVLTPEGKRDWTLSAKLGATIVQDCVVTFAPVTTRIDTAFTRQYRDNLPEPTGDEMEMPEDDSVEGLPTELDLMALLTEALSLEIPDFPRAPDVELGEAVFAAPGVTPMTDQDAKPLAGLAALRDQLQSRDSDEE